jgi:hypothetical protein
VCFASHAYRGDDAAAQRALSVLSLDVAMPDVGLHPEWVALIGQSGGRYQQRVTPQWTVRSFKVRSVPGMNQ